ncbi:MAG: 3-phosphoshikimate 1-carboxyvinyltransferase [Saprospiraceae bacterium]|nr:3-phosphoshikimate 1-carboxyvinyltransferase [Saprospiraceae bacterium]
MVGNRIRLHFPKPVITGTIHLDGSKSISNRALIMQALAGNANPQLDHLSTSVDTLLMQQLLMSREDVLDAGAAGTTFRFLTAYLATQERELVLTGSERMKQRPIGELVNTLNDLGAGIEFVEREGYPPLRFTGKPLIQLKQKIRIRASISSQYISALLMIAPALPDGLEIQLAGEVISRPYIEMTLAMMKHFGIFSEWVDDTISIEPQSYQSRPLFVEGDWSAASYYYSLAAISKEVNLDLYGIKDHSLQGDSAIASIGRLFNIETQYHQDHVILTKSNAPLPASIEWDFIQCPDLAQTVFTMCAATGVKGVFTGLQTLRIKETDRIAAMKAELKKVNVPFFQLPSRMSKQNEYHMVEGKAHFEDTPLFSTYEDHRMAMCLAPLALLHPIEIEHPAVVGKSYPEFWKDLKSLGGVIEEI